MLVASGVSLTVHPAIAKVKIAAATICELICEFIPISCSRKL
ncbi:hypothetical protein [Sphaerospermopsis kisseleviana]